MAAVIAELVPGAVGLVLVNPLPIIAIMVLMLAPSGQRRAFAFLAGWAGGLALVLAAFVWLVPLDRLTGATGEPAPIAAALRLVLGLLLLGLAVQKWRTRAAGPDAPAPPPPRWMQTLDQASPGLALAIGVALASVNPKNLAFTLPAALTLDSAAQSAPATIIAIAVFVVIGSLGVLLPVLIHELGGAAARATLAGWRAGLTRHYNVIMAVVFILFGVMLVSRGLGDLLR